MGNSLRRAEQNVDRADCILLADFFYWPGDKVTFDSSGRRTPRAGNSVSIRRT